MSDEGVAQAGVSEALVRVESAQFMPAMTIVLAVERYNTITEFVSRLMKQQVER